jgi:hypothetical protein
MTPSKLICFKKFQDDVILIFFNIEITTFWIHQGQLGLTHQTFDPSHESS